MLFILSAGQKISIHALREEGDSALWTSARARYDFYPRPPRGGRLECIGPRHGAKKISIHALREEGDGHRQGSGAGAGHFYPRPPRGGRRSSPPPGHRWSRYFYPRPPRGGRRDQSVCPNFIHFISIHALREEGDVIVGDVLVCCGGISIHALREEGDHAKQTHTTCNSNFYPRPPRGGRRQSRRRRPLRR